MQIIIPIVLILASVGAFFGYINPQYIESQKLEEKKVVRDEALNKSRELQALRDDLLKKLNMFSSRDTDRLEKMLPDNIDNVRLIIDISAIAAKRGVTVKNVKNPSTATDPKAGIVVDQNKYGSAVLAISVSATYDNFIAFLRDLEKSLRLVDVISVSFTAPDVGSVYDFNVGLRTYWLK